MALAAANGRVQFQYLKETKHANRQTALMVERLSAASQLAPETAVILDVADRGMTRLVANFTRGHPTVTLAGERGWHWPLEMFQPALFVGDAGEKSVRLTQALEKAHNPLQFDLAPESRATHHFFRDASDELVKFGHAVLVAPAADRTVVNSSAGLPQYGSYHLRPMEGVSNHLSLVDTDLGHITIPGLIENVALWQREGDFVVGGAGVQAMGRHLLFEVLNPTPQSRMVLDYTPGLLLARQADLHASVIGERRAGFDFVGRGAGRMVSDPLTPREINGRYYVAIDMGIEPERMVTTTAAGIAGLYNQQLGLDPRRIVGWARNISLVSEEKFQAMIPPAAVSSFPAGLFQPGLLFSGVYEEGWMAERARFRLKSQNAQGLSIVANVPGGKPELADATIEVAVDGDVVAHRQASTGDIEVVARISPSAAPRWIEIRVSFANRLSEADPRISSILLKSISLH